MNGSTGVVLTIRNRDAQRALNCLRALASQSVMPECVALVNFGDPIPELESCDLPFQYIYRHLPQADPWSIAVARNQGIRLLAPVGSILLLDVDMLVAPNFIECGQRLLQKGTLLNCQIRDLPQEAVTAATDVVADFPKLQAAARLRPGKGLAIGACQWMSREALFALRGQDETYRMWAYQDMDLQRRARWLGLRPVWLGKQTQFLHQWHESKDKLLKSDESNLAQEWYARNRRRFRSQSMAWDIGELKPGGVNPGGWGKML